MAADVFDDGSMVRDVFMSVSCAGNESNLLDCRTEPFSGINCPSSGVICQGKTATVLDLARLSNLSH